jgi:hypothetical protein
VDVGSAVTTASSFVATKIVFLVISGAATTVVGAWSIWATIRAGRAAFVYVRSRLSPRILQAWVALRVRKLAQHSALGDFAGGGQVRLVGVVEATDMDIGHAEFSGAPAVVSSHEVGERGGGSVERTLAAHDFSLRLSDGSKVKVMASDAAAHHALLLVDPRPHRWKGDRVKGGWFCESRVAPGDEVEVIGRLSREVDPHAERASDRQPALSWIVVAAKERLALRFKTRRPLELAAVPED